MFTIVAAFFAPSPVPNPVPVMDVVYNQKLNLFLVGVDILEPHPRKRVWTFHQFEDVAQFGVQNGLIIQAEIPVSASGSGCAFGRQPATKV